MRKELSGFDDDCGALGRALGSLVASYLRVRRSAFLKSVGASGILTMLLVLAPEPTANRTLADALGTNSVQGICHDWITPGIPALVASGTRVPTRLLAGAIDPTTPPPFRPCRRRKDRTQRTTVRISTRRPRCRRINAMWGRHRDAVHSRPGGTNRYRLCGPGAAGHIPLIGTPRPIRS